LLHNGDATPAPASPTVDTPSSPISTAPTFRGGIDLVALTVVVTDPQRHLVTGLAQNDFAVFEDGVRQDLSFFAAQRVPLDLSLLLDTSASMTDKMATMREAAIGFASTLSPGDRISVVEIKDTLRVVHPLDEDLEGARAAIRGMSARGGTALYNGLYMTLRDMMTKRRAAAAANADNVRRQAIVTFSDGEDTASLLSFDDVLDTAKQAGVAIYTIALRAPELRDLSPNSKRYFSNSDFAMKELARESGALSFFPTDIRDLAGVYQQIATELANQYAIGYSSKNPKRDGSYRHVVVKVMDHPGAQTRTRAGYQSPRGDPRSDRANLQ
jgi:VWFA-related protein